MLIQPDVNLSYQEGMKASPRKDREPDRTAFLWKDARKEAGWVFLISRLILLVVTYLGPSKLAQQGLQKGTLISPHDCAFNLNHCLLSWDTWDVGVFVDVAYGGYAHRPPGKYNLSAYFPLWPLIMHIFGGPFHNPYTSLFFTGLVLTNLCLYCGLVLLYYLVRAHFGPTVAKDALFFLAIGPYALFFLLDIVNSSFAPIPGNILLFTPWSYPGLVASWSLRLPSGPYTGNWHCTCHSLSSYPDTALLALPDLAAYSLVATTKCYSSYDINSTWPLVLHALSLHHHGRPTCIQYLGSQDMGSLPNLPLDRHNQ